ncbi:MAG: hypothetical protein AAF525_20485, partial [Pseudomonadota bacterium]
TAPHIYYTVFIASQFSTCCHGVFDRCNGFCIVFDGRYMGANDNAERIAAIEDTMAAGADVTGNSYCVISMGSSIFKLDVAAVDTNTFDPGDDTVDQGVFGAAVFGFSGGIVFNPDGTVDASVFDDAFDEVFANDHFDDPDYQRGAVDQWMWTQEGNNVNIIFQEPGEEDEIDPMTVDSSGSVLIFGVADNERSGDDSGDWYETVITIGVKVASIETCGGYVEPLEF